MYYPPGSMGYEGSAPYYMYNQGMPNQYNPPMHGANPANSSPSSSAMAQHTFNTNAPSFVPSKASKAIKIVNPVSKKVVDPAAAAASSSTQSPTPDSKADEAKTADTESEKPATESKDANNTEPQNDQKDSSDKGINHKLTNFIRSNNILEKQTSKLEEPKVDNYIINQGVPSIPITLSYAKPGISKAVKITPPPAPVEVKPVEQPVEPTQEQPKSVESAIPNGESKVPATGDSEETASKPLTSEPEEIKSSEKTEKDAPESTQKVTESSQASDDQPSATDKPSTADDSSIQSTLRYQRDFLLSFKENCTIKPTNMKPIEDIVIDSPSREGERKPSNRRQNSSHHGKFNRGDSSGSFDFNVSKAKTTSEERFKMSTQMQNSNRHPLGQRSSSGGPGNNMDGMGHFGKETRSSRGRGGDKNRRYQQQGGPTIPLDQVAPLEKSENRWVPQTTQAKSSSDVDEEEKLARQIKALLNKLTLEKFQAISDQILEIANLSISDNGLALRTVIYLIFEKATDEANFAAIYARLCQKILECLDSNVKDEDFKDKDGNHVMGGNLFRKYLLMRCQSEFEKGWRLSDEYKEKTIVDYSDEYYAAAKAKRRGLGLVRFIGELFKQNMLSSRIMNECIVKLLQSEIPEEEEIESLTKLMATVGPMLEQREDSKQRFVLYFDKIASLSKNPALPSRHRFMLKDLLDLRKDNWVPRNNTNSGPKTIAQIHQDAQKEKEQSEILKRVNSSGPRGPSLAQHGRSYSGKIDKAPRNPEGWNTISSSTTSKKIGDLTSFGNFDRSKTSNQSLGPSSNNVFDSLQNVKPAPREKEAPAKKTTLTNMFDMLNDDDSHDDGHDAKPESASKAQSEPKADEAAPSSEKLPTSPEAIKRRVDSTINEFFNLKDFNEAKLCFKEFVEMNCTKVAIQALIFSSLEKKTEDVELAIKLIQKLDEESIIKDRKVYIEALTVVMESAEDLSYDVPQLWSLLGLILAGIPSLKFTDLSVILEPLLQSPARLPPGPKLVANYINELKKTKVN
jgi:translation initiation factor 4G